MRIARHLNWPLALSAAFLVGVGLASLWGYAHHHFYRQAVFCAVAIAVLFVTVRPNYLYTRRAAWVLYAACAAALVALLFFGKVTRGARGWFSVGPIMVQPAEFAKIVTVIALARFMAYQRNLQRWTGLVGPFAIVALPAGLIFLQPDFGTAILFGPVLLAMLFAAGARVKYVAAILLAAAIVLPLAFRYGLKEYQQNRLLSFIQPDKVPKELRFQQDQSVKACASGGPSGRGLGESGIAQPFYIPDRHTDFIFSIVSEELGFAGGTLVLIMFAMFIYQALKIAWLSREPYGRLLVVGLTVFTTMQVVINVGMTIGVAPITGLTLPFVSYGGSSLVTSAISIGLILNVGSRWVPSFSTRDLAGSLEMRMFAPADSLRSVL